MVSSPPFILPLTPFNQVLQRWAELNTFAVEKEISRDGSAPFSILMPPPNVTGNLHAGHALTFTIQVLLAAAVALLPR